MARKPIIKIELPGQINDKQTDAAVRPISFAEVIRFETNRIRKEIERIYFFSSSDARESEFGSEFNSHSIKLEQS